MAEEIAVFEYGQTVLQAYFIRYIAKLNMISYFVFEFLTVHKGTRVHDKMTVQIVRI